jgi:hypothetical protein
MRNLIGEMGVPRSTAYLNVGLLTDKGYLVKNGEVYNLTDRGRRFAETDRETFDNLVFWLWRDLGDEKLARETAASFLFRQPVETMRLLANTEASRTALALAGAKGSGALAALPWGRHTAWVFARSAGDSAAPGVLLRRPAVCVSDGDGNCALELDAEHVRRIVLACGRRRGPCALLWFLADGVWIRARETAGRLHVRGDALAPIGFARKITESQPFPIIRARGDPSKNHTECDSSWNCWRSAACLASSSDIRRFPHSDSRSSLSCQNAVASDRSWQASWKRACVRQSNSC